MGEIMELKKQDDYYICVSNAFVKANQDLSLIESKILRLAICQVTFDDTEIYEYQTTISELAEILETSKKFLYNNINKTSTNLLRQIIRINYSKKEWDKFQIFSKFKYKDGTINLRLNDEMKPFILALRDNYTQYQIAEIIGMNSVYGVRLYELILSKRQKKGLKNLKFEIIKLTIDEIRFATNTTDKYTKISQLQERVISTAIKAIMLSTGIAIDFKPVKKSRKFVAYDFMLYGLEFEKEKQEIYKKYNINPNEFFENC